MSMADDRVPANHSLSLPSPPLPMAHRQACWVLCEIGGKPFSPVVVCHLSAKLRHKMLQRLRSREKRVHGADWPDIDETMVEYIVNQARLAWMKPRIRKTFFFFPLQFSFFATKQPIAVCG